MPYGMGLISVGAEHMVAVRADGTVAAEGSNDKGQCDVGDWQDIIAVAAGEYHTVGLRADGKMVRGGTSGYYCSPN